MKKGDTLIEVTIAIGIFSLIAIGVASVTSSGVAGSQSALETTLAREEIDTQAEAIRFIHNAYIGSKGTDDNNIYANIWGEIIGNAASSPGDVPSDCASLYQNGLPRAAFVLNPHNLNSLNSGATYISYSKNDKKFEPTPTYPRLLYGYSNSDSDESLVDINTSTNLYRAQGIYVVAVKGTDTKIVGLENSFAAYYDFYIRTCWYGLDNETPSTVSTVIRLYNTPVADSPTYSPNLGNYLTVKYNTNYNGNPVQYTSTPTIQYVEATDSYVISDFDSPYKNRFRGWKLAGDDSTVYWPGDPISAPDLTNGSQTWSLEAVWDTTEYSVIFDANGGSFANADPSGRDDLMTVNCLPFQSECDPEFTIPESYFNDSFITRSGYKFLGWSATQGATVPDYTADGNKSLGELNENTTLYAVWKENNETYYIKLTWDISTDYDSYIYGQMMSGGYFTANYSNKSPSETVSGVSRTLASLDHDCTGSCRNETFTINTLGGKDFYYFVRNYSSNSSITNATVTITRQDGSVVATYPASDATGSGRVWNVFAYKNGQIVRHQRRTSSGSSSGTDGAELNY